MAFRVPTADVSVIDFTFRTENESSIEKIDSLMKKASETYLKGVLEYSDEEVVSTDFIHSSSSAVYDSITTLRNNFKDEKNAFKIIAWYDNEWGYSNRVVDLLRYMISKKA
jgi:glyceraldehyde 3-phosphate dehydrogenase